EPQHHGLAVRRRQKKVIAEFSRGRDRHRLKRGERHGPIDLSRLRIEPVDRRTGPDDELAFSGSVIDHRRAVAYILSIERAPNLFAVVFIESDDGASSTADHTNQFLAVEQRVGGETPNRRASVVFLLEIVLP